MRVIRAAGQNVSPADDGRLYSKAFADGLFEDVAISSLGTNLVSIGALYGIICGRDFTAEAQNVNVVLPETEGTTEGVIYVEIDISSDDVITIGSALKPFTPTYEDINMNGVVAQMVIAEYTATPVAVTDVTTVYPVATAGGIGSMATIELSPVQNSYSVGDFLVWKGQLYKVIAAIASGESLVIGTNIEAVTIGSELTALNTGLTFTKETITGSIAGASTNFTLFTFPHLGNLKLLCGNGNVNVSGSSGTKHAQANYENANFTTVLGGSYIAAGGGRPESTMRYVDMRNPDYCDAYINTSSSYSNVIYSLYVLGY